MTYVDSTTGDIWQSKEDYDRIQRIAQEAGRKELDRIKQEEKKYKFYSLTISDKVK